MPFAKRPIERPVAAFILSLLGGLFFLAGGIFLLLLTPSYYYGPYYGGNPYAWVGLIGVGTGGAIVVGAVLTYFVPRYRVGWGVLILVSGVAGIYSLYGIGSGWAIFGVPLAIVGGSLAIAWKPAAVLAFDDYRTCLACGRHVRAEFPVCPYCGTRTGAKPAGVPAPEPPR